MSNYKKHILCWNELRKNWFFELAEEIKGIWESLRLNEVLQEYASKDENIDFNFLKGLYVYNK